MQSLTPASLPLQPPGLEQVILLQQTATHTVCRLVCGPRSYILKWFHSPGPHVEVQTYALLARYGVETLPVYQRTNNALLLEDLQNSATWRLADLPDMEQAETGRAVAAWYRTLHRAGRAALEDPGQPAAFLSPWVSVLTPSSLARAGLVFGVTAQPAWQLAIQSIDALKAKYLALPLTFNYSDFAMENLALSCAEHPPLRAIVFDYDNFALGAAGSDWRNVRYAMGGPAKTAFAEAFGPVPENEMLLDEPLSFLEGLVVASQRSRMPQWAAPLVEAISNDQLERSILKALEA